jgi:chromate transporter
MRAEPSVTVAAPEAPAAPGLASIFLAFLKLGSIAFGGVYGMLACFERELVERRRWLTADELAESVVVGQVTPGPPIVNTGVFVGYRLRGLAGAVAATAGQILPGFLVVVAVGTAYAELRHHPLLAGALRGIAAAVVGLLGSVALKLGRRAAADPRGAAIAAACLALLLLARANPILLLAGSALAGRLWLGGKR